MKIQIILILSSLFFNVINAGKYSQPIRYPNLIISSFENTTKKDLQISLSPIINSSYALNYISSCTKASLNYVLDSSDSLPDARHDQTASEELGRFFPCVSCAIIKHGKISKSYQFDFQLNAVKFPQRLRVKIYCWKPTSDEGFHLEQPDESEDCFIKFDREDALINLKVIFSEGNFFLVYGTKSYKISCSQE